MGVNFETKDNKLTISIEGSLDSLNAEEIYKEVENQLNSFEGDIIFDLEKLEYISSAGLQVLLMAAKKVDAKGFSAYISKPKSMVDEVLKISGFYSFLKKME
ncbi:STAS domain-containing protein [Hippea alviniae]|uniref:STAS domain-containing protein n=1 Tax=Hippea alviniae TaxID=1279027 RepID=UPI0003B77E71|nr:STAS domain-containing protein [Hippea alviniae]